MSYSGRLNENEDELLHWYPMRVTYNRAMNVKREFDLNADFYADIRYFLPVREEVSSSDGIPCVRITPLISSLIFIYASKARIMELKQQENPCGNLRFITFPSRGCASSDYSGRKTNNRIITVGDNEMNTFMEATKQMEHKITLVPYSELKNNVGRRIRFVDGPMKGREGVLRRYDGNRHVFVDIEGFVSAQFVYVPKSMYELL